MTNLLHQHLNYNDKILDKMVQDLDNTVMDLPSIEDPHLLIAQVRRHYFEYLIKLLSVNYENYQKLLGKNIYLPSAIWRCAKSVELNAVKMCMVTDLYRKNIIAAINKLQADTKKGKLNKHLFDCLKRPPENEKKLQTSVCTCVCTCGTGATKRRKTSTNSRNAMTEQWINESKVTDMETIPAPINNSLLVQSTITDKSSQPNKLDVPRMSIESQTVEDEVMLQMEQLFQTGSQDDEDLFESTLCDDTDHVHNKTAQESAHHVVTLQTSSQAQQIKSLDERLALLESTGILNMPKEPPKEPEIQKPKKPMFTKWLCETYYQKKYLYEKLDEIRERNRKKHSRIKIKFCDYFGDDSDEEDEIMSPMEESPELIRSCKERIAPWVVKFLTPHYVKGRIIGKTLFKACAKHLIKLIIICSQYPNENDVKSFILDFLKSHKMIRCEADFTEFSIANI